MAISKHDHFVTTTRRLNRELPPMRLYEKAKKFGVWNPSDIDLAQDKADWHKLSDDSKDIILRLTALYQASEEAVTLDLLPLIMTIAIRILEFFVVRCMMNISNSANHIWAYTLPQITILLPI